MQIDNRNVKVLKLMLNNIEIVESYNCGLCKLASYLFHKKEISYEEYSALMNIIEDNPPFRFFKTLSASQFYWKRGKINPRKSWLKRMIKKYT